MTFGTGGRRCPGSPLGKTMSPILIAYLFTHYEFYTKNADGKVPMDSEFGLTISLTSPYVYVRERS